MRLALTILSVLMLATPALAQGAAPGQNPFRRPGVGAPPPGSLREGSGPASPGALFLKERPGNTLLATDYLGGAVLDPDKVKVGSITNLVVDTTGRIAGVVLDVGEFLGVGAKEVAIAFEALYPVLEDGKEMFVVDLTRAQLMAAPPFNRSP